jgi:hypothetical protein
MSRQFCAAVAIAAAAATTAPTPFAAGAQPPPARVQVSAAEFSLAMSRATTRSGALVIQLVNYGEDDHDLAVRRVGGTRTYRLGIVHPGSVGDLDVRLGPGRYRLWCTLADHRARGMTATLRIR